VLGQLSELGISARAADPPMERRGKTRPWQPQTQSPGAEGEPSTATERISASGG
jgi:hypothetical protein